MKVHLTSTPEFSFDVLKEVESILTQIPGKLDFILEKPLTSIQYSLVHPKFNAINEIEDLEFEELFKLCDTYRTFKEIPEDEYVIMVTSIFNKDNWFSAFSSKNIFIHGDDWEYYTKRDAKFGISYSVLENIFHSQIELDINDIDNEPNIHQESIGCINDMCSDKKDVMLKLRTADICDSCITRAEQKNINPLVLEHILTSIENLRKIFVNSNRIKSKVKPEPVHIDSQRKVKIGDKNVNILPLQRVLFIFFLKNPQGVETKLVCEHQNELVNIYKEIKKSAESIRIQRMFDIDKNGDPSFDIHKSKLNKFLFDTLGPNLSDFYLITKVDIKDSMNIYKINLEEGYITIDPTD